MEDVDLSYREEKLTWRFIVDRTTRKQTVETSDRYRADVEAFLNKHGLAYAVYPIKDLRENDR